MIARSHISHARRAGGALRVEIADFGEIVLRRDRPADMALAAGLAAAFPARTHIDTWELKMLPVEIEIADDGGRFVVRALGAPAIAAPAGPAAISASRAAFFGDAMPWRWGRAAAAFKIKEGEVCARCGAPAAEAHHVEPRAHGGDDGDENREALCAPCHRAEHRTPPRLRAGQRVVEVVGTAGEAATIRILLGEGVGRYARVEWPDAALGVWRAWLVRRAGERRMRVAYWEAAEVVRPAARLAPVAP